MADKMDGQQEEDEELIAAFKKFGATDVNDVISIETLRDNLMNLGAEEFNDEDLWLIFDEIAGASKKPLLRDTKSANSNGFDPANTKHGISFEDFMLMMMAK